MSGTLFLCDENDDRVPISLYLGAKLLRQVCQVLGNQNLDGLLPRARWTAFGAIAGHDAAFETGEDVDQSVAYVTGALALVGSPNDQLSRFREGNALSEMSSGFNALQRRVIARSVTKVGRNVQDVDCSSKNVVSVITVHGFGGRTDCKHELGFFV